MLAEGFFFFVLQKKNLEVTLKLFRRPREQTRRLTGDPNFRGQKIGSLFFTLSAIGSWGGHTVWRELQTFFAFATVLRRVLKQPRREFCEGSDFIFRQTPPTLMLLLGIRDEHEDLALLSSFEKVTVTSEVPRVPLIREQ